MIELYFFIGLNSFGFYEHYGVLATILSVYRTLGQYAPTYLEQKRIWPLRFSDNSARGLFRREAMVLPPQ
jgi:hypothetical protein